jgi:hypothetical protein
VRVAAGGVRQPVPVGGQVVVSSRKVDELDQCRGGVGCGHAYMQHYPYSFFSTGKLPGRLGDGRTRSGCGRADGLIAHWLKDLALRGCLLATADAPRRTLAARHLSQPREWPGEKSEPPGVAAQQTDQKTTYRSANSAPLPPAPARPAHRSFESRPCGVVRHLPKDRVLGGRQRVEQGRPHRKVPARRTRPSRRPAHGASRRVIATPPRNMDVLRRRAPNRPCLSTRCGVLGTAGT